MEIRHVLAIGAAGLLATSAAQPPAAKLPPAETSSSGQAIQSLTFMTGTWRGQMEGGLSEEQWSAPEGNNAMGMFRWLAPDGKPVMFEMMTMTQEPEGVFLRLVHFNSKLVAREGKDEAVTLRLAETGSNKAVFKGAETEKRVASAGYEVKGDTLHVSIHFVDPARQPLEFDFKRAIGR
jgi:hypothetical protein